MLVRNVIITRKLRRYYSTSRTVLIRIGKPRKVSAAEWECAYEVTNMGMRQVMYGRGIDGFQSLIQAIEGVRVFLEKNGKELSWEGGEKGETGVPRYVPGIFGKRFAQHLGKLIDREIVRMSRVAERRYLERKKGVRFLVKSQDA